MKSNGSANNRPLQGRADLSVEQSLSPGAVDPFYRTPDSPPSYIPPAGAPRQFILPPQTALPSYAVPQQNYLPYAQQYGSPYMVQPGMPASPQSPYAMPSPYNNQAPGEPPGDQLSAPAQSKLDQQKHLFGGITSLRSLLSGGVGKNVPPAERPSWIPAYAYTNDSMVAPYHNLDIFWWDKRSMPDRPQRVILSTSVTRYWRGPVANPCYVIVEPFAQAPGNFIFRSLQPGGPQGWLQALSAKDFSGFPLYRYWFGAL